MPQIPVQTDTLKDIRDILKEIVETDTNKKWKASERVYSPTYFSRISRDKVDSALGKLERLLEDLK